MARAGLAYRGAVMGALLAHAAQAQSPPGAHLKPIYEFRGPVHGYAGNGATFTTGANGVVYGLSGPGSHRGGGIFALLPPAGGSGKWRLQQVFAFPAPQQLLYTPVGPPALDQDGNFYVEISIAGQVLRVAPPGPGETKYHVSVIATVGGYPSGGLTVGAGGVLFGTTQVGGSGQGSVFELTPPRGHGKLWHQTTLVSLSGADGNTAYGTVLQGPGGEVYAVTGYGGAGNGTVIMLTPPAGGSGAWAETVLHTFNLATDGGTPNAGLVRDAAGVLYGVAVEGGAGGYGTAFSLTPQQGGGYAYQVLHAFTGRPDAQSPAQPLVLQPGGTLLGTSEYGCLYGNELENGGCIFKLTPPRHGSTNWTEAPLYSFGLNTLHIGQYPYGNIVAAAGGIVGATGNGGAFDMGAAFLLTP
jgi:hypothetical protein